MHPQKYILSLRNITWNMPIQIQSFTLKIILLIKTVPSITFMLLVYNLLK